MIEIIVIIAVPVAAYFIYSKIKINKLQKELVESEKNLTVAKNNIKILENAIKEKDRINEVRAKVDSYTDDDVDSRLRDKWTKRD